MNTSTRTALRLLIATPLAASALVLGGYAGVAQAETPGVDPNPGPVIVLPGDDEDPRPEGPGDITNPEDDDPRPEGPGDITNPEDEDEPEVPDDKDGPNPGDDDPQIPGDKDGPNPGDTPEDVPGDDVPGDDVPEDVPADKGGDKGGDKNDVAGTADVQVPNRIDAGSGPVEDEGFGLALLIAGGGVVAAAGSVLARQRVAQRNS